MGRIFLSQVISAVSPKDREASSDTVFILTDGFLGTGRKINDFDTQLPSDRKTKT